MMLDSSSNSILLDVGSTIIKYFRIDASDQIIDGGYFPRDYRKVVGDQVMSILSEDILWDANRDKLRICSSANGGLSVGIIGLTERFSAAWASRAVLNAGANVRWSIDLKDPKIILIPVDILVIAGGVCNSPVENQITWLREIKTLPLNFETVIFAGNNSLIDVVKSIWPNAYVTKNILGEDLRWQGDGLVDLLQNAYLNDLVLQKGISKLQQYSETPILPTPAIVQESYKKVINGNSSLHFSPPFILIDIGGATTDIYYGGELVSEGQGRNPLSSINRHVFTHLGITASRDSLIFELSNSNYLGDFLRAIDEESAERRYLSLREGHVDWMTPKILAEACCFLALNACASGLPSGHKIELRRVSSIVVTGGASQICQITTLEKIFRASGAQNACAYLDKGYEIWMEGMLQLEPILKKGI